MGVKVAILEKDGEEFFTSVEHDLQAEEVYFAELGWNATDVKGAIVEGRTGTEALLIFVVSITRNGSMSNGDWFGKGELLGSTPTFVFPRNMKLLGISWGNTNASTDFDLEFYKNGRGTTKFRTYEARNKTYDYAYGWTDIFAAGNYLDIKYIDQGDNVSDMGLDIFFTAV
jgi:hypothetical protein